MREEIENLGLDVGYGLWKQTTWKKQPLLDIQTRDHSRKGLHNVPKFIGACKVYRRHIYNLTYSSAPLIDVIKETNRWGWSNKEEACFQ